jgi:hypothetical protein
MHGFFSDESVERIKEDVSISKKRDSLPVKVDINIMYHSI